jgi:hypothetical protein
MDENNANPCPNKHQRKSFISCARFSHSPHDDKLNMLPNFEYFKHKSNKPPRKLSDDPHNNCAYCSLSFYTTYNQCCAVIESMTSVVWRKLEYTHVCIGDIDENDGCHSDIEGNGHFMLWEFEGVDLIKKFTNLHLVTK